MKAIPFYPDAHLAKTAHLSLAEEGAFFRLLMHAWMSKGCCLPSDERRLARIVRATPGEWKKIRPAVMELWQLVDDRWVQPRLTQEWLYVREKSAKAQKSAQQRWKPVSN